MNIRILYLYPELMNLYGEHGNVLMLKKCFEQSGLDVTCDRKDVGDEINFSDYDITYIGCGTESASYKALECLRPYKREIKEFTEKNKILIATGNSFELFGDYINDDKLGNFDGLKIFEYGIIRTHKKRFLGDAIFTCMQEEHKIIGFINKCSKICGVSSPLFNVEMGLGNDNAVSTEGFTYKNVFATNLIGPLLVRNPYFCQFILNTTYNNIGFSPLLTPDMSYQIKAYNTALSELTALHRKK